MLTVFIWLLTAVLLIDCLFLVLLVLVQLPKKDAGAGLAFGGAATDALFGAGSGTALTQITKYAAAIFFVVTLALVVLQARDKQVGPSEVFEKLQQQSTTPGTTLPTQPGAPGTLPTPQEVIPAAPQVAPADVPPTANPNN